MDNNPSAHDKFALETSDVADQKVQNPAHDNLGLDTSDVRSEDQNPETGPSSSQQPPLAIVDEFYAFVESKKAEICDDIEQIRVKMLQRAEAESQHIDSVIESLTKIKDHLEKHS